VVQTSFATKSKTLQMVAVPEDKAMRNLYSVHQLEGEKKIAVPVYRKGDNADCATSHDTSLLTTVYKNLPTIHL